MPETVSLSIVVPCYNEEGNIPAMLKNFKSALAGREGIELILVDNGSTDGTGKAIEAGIAIERSGFAKKVRVEKNQGYGFGILTGLQHAKGELLSWTHADLQTDPCDVLRAYDEYLKRFKENGKMLVKGRRINRRPAEKIFSAGMQILASLILGARLSEINAQPKLFPRVLYQEMKNPPYDFSLDLYLMFLARKKGYQIFSIPVDFSRRNYGEAKGGGGTFKKRWQLIQKTLQLMFKLRSRTGDSL